MSGRDRVAAAAAVGLAVGAAVLVALLRVATWGGPDGGATDVSEMPFGLLLLFVVGVLVLVGRSFRAVGGRTVEDAKGANMQFRTPRNAVATWLVLLVAAGCADDDRRVVAASRWTPLESPGAPATTGPENVALIKRRGQRGTELIVASLAGRRRRVVARSTSVRGGEAGLTAPVLSPDGRWIAVADGSSTSDGRDLTIVRVAPVQGVVTARPVPGLRLIDADGFRPVWTPDSKAIAVPAAHSVDLVNVRSGRRRVLFRQRRDDVAFAPDGKALAFDGPGGIWLTTKNDPPRLIAEDAQDPVWSPDSKRIAYLSARDRHGSVAVSEGPPQAAREIYVARRDGRDARRLTETTADELGPLRWTRDGRAIVFSRLGDRRLSVRVLDVGHRCERPLALAADVQPPGGDLNDWDVRASSTGVSRRC